MTPQNYKTLQIYTNFSQKKFTKNYICLLIGTNYGNFADCLTQNRCIVMRRIEFIAPVEAMRGNLSGSQKLEYALNNNPAFDAPLGRQYAKNYQPRFIGAKRASDGHKYFGLRTKSATLITVASRKRMAVLGGCGSMIGIILTSISLGGSRDKLEQSWQWEIQNVPSQAGKTFRKFLTDKLYQMLNVGLPAAEFYTAGPVYSVLNPWCYNQSFSTTDPTVIVVSVPNDILVKFWLQLCCDEDYGFTNVTPIYFYVDGAQGIAVSTMLFNFLVGSRLNVLNLTTEEVGQESYMKKGDKYIKDNEGYALGDNVIDGDFNYTTTTVAPE